jgi:hypothetical protein
MQIQAAFKPGLHRIVWRKQYKWAADARPL